MLPGAPQRCMGTRAPRDALASGGAFQVPGVTFSLQMTTMYRPAVADDLDEVARLLEQYVRETYHGAWHGTADRLARDGLGAHFSLMLAAAGALIGVAAWRRTYDLHYCLPGCEVIDMFVLPAYRGRGIGPCLLASTAAHAAEAGATFMTGGAVDTGAAGKLYRRATISHGGQPYLSGRAFRAFAGLAGATPRELLGRMPPQEWNRQA